MPSSSQGDKDVLKYAGVLGHTYVVVIDDGPLLGVRHSKRAIGLMRSRALRENMPISARSCISKSSLVSGKLFSKGNAVSTGKRSMSCAAGFNCAAM